MKISAVVIGDGAFAPAGWSISRCAPSTSAIAAGIERAVADGPDVVALWDARVPAPPRDVLDRFVASDADVWHSGLHRAHPELDDLLRLVRPMTWLTLAMPPGLECSSWRLNASATLLRPQVLAPGVALDDRIRSIDLAMLDWGLRLQRAGCILRHQPDLPPGPPRSGAADAGDPVRVLASSFGAKWALFAALRRIHRPGLLRATLRMSRTGVRPATRTPWTGPARPERARRPIHRVSVIIPTLGRPDQLGRLLDQLGDQSRAPDEVVVADQSRSSERSGLVERDDGLHLEVIQLTERGQSTARNAAIAATSGDLVVLLDDDEEVPRSLIEQHVDAIEATGADALAGGVDVPGHAPEPPSPVRVAETFPGGHSSVRRSALGRSGLFDPTFDLGPRADADLGVRLTRSGALVLYTPDIRIVHHHAMDGGLRTIGARRVTRTSARSSWTKRNLPAPTQLYLGLRHWDRREVRDSLVLNVASNFSHDGPALDRIARAAIQLVLLPDTVRQVRRNLAIATRYLAARPPIPTLDRP